MKYTYKELKGLPEGIKTNLINGAGQKLNKLTEVDLDKLNLGDLNTTRIMSMTLAFRGLQLTYQSIDDYTDYIIAGVHEKELERTPELKTELENMAEVINTDLSNIYLKMVPYVMTDKEIQAVIDKGLTKKQQNDEILNNLLDAIKEITGEDVEVKEVGEDEDERVITKETEEQVKEPQQEDNTESDLIDLLRILFTSN